MVTTLLAALVLTSVLPTRAQGEAKDLYPIPESQLNPMYDPAAAQRVHRLETPSCP